MMTVEMFEKSNLGTIAVREEGVAVAYVRARGEEGLGWLLIFGSALNWVTSEELVSGGFSIQSSPVMPDIFLRLQHSKSNCF